MARPTIDQYLMGLAQLAAGRTTCVRRGVGCVLADETGRVLSIGYNGVASGLPHCNQRLRGFEAAGIVVDDSWPHACKGYDLPPGQDSCEAVHAEQNALLQCSDPRRIRTAYVTLSPCKACLKLLLNTPCERIVFLEEHVDPVPKELWLSRLGRRWDKLDGATV